jgi:competence protein ComEC
MVAVEPRVLWDVSFQLSFAAMAGIATLTEPLVVRLRPLGGVPADGDLQTQPLRSFVVFASATTIAATLSTWPLVAFYFERVSLVGLPATLLTLPIMPVVLVAHGAAGLVGIVSDELARPIGWVAWVSTAYMTTVVGLIARLPGTSVQTGGLAPALVVGYYAGLAVVHWRGRVLQAVSVPLDLIRRWQPPWDRAISWWIAGPAAALAVLVWSAAFSLPDGDLHVTFVDVGQGDMAVVTTPNGRTIVVDGGPDPLAAARVIGDELPFWRRHIDLVVLTHPHQDHVAGVAELLDRYEVSHVVQRAVDYDSTAYETWNTAVDGEGAIVTDAAAGQSIVTDDGVLIQVLGPPAKLLSGSDSDVDNASVVLRIVYGELSFLLAADVFADGERALVDGRSVLDSDVLKVAHHGSRSSSISEFIEAVSPAAAVVSAGEGNRFGHPHAETLEVLHRHVTVDRLFVTSARGSVEFVTDGKHLRVYSER